MSKLYVTEFLFQRGPENTSLQSYIHANIFQPCKLDVMAVELNVC